MKVRATQNGYFNQPVNIERRGHTVAACFILPGDVFEHEGLLGSWMEPVDEEGKATASDRRGIMAQLDAAGISYFKGAPIEKLQSLLPKEG